MKEKDFEYLKKIVLASLDGLSPHLTYHSKGHTIDVIEQSIRIAKAEGIGGHDLLALKIAALFHDNGFLRTYQNHEAMGCKIFLEHVEGLGFSDEDKDKIQALIMATKIPQMPQTHLQQIICDADLDYLGRPDFFDTGNNLRKEFMYYNVVTSDEDWMKLQLNFLSHHRYHTRTSQKLREPAKQRYLARLIEG